MLIGRLVALAVLTAGLAVGVQASADAAPRWPTPRITYADHTSKPGLVKEAVRRWNAASGVKLVRVTGSRGRIQILPRTSPSCAGSAACAQYPPDGRVFMGTRWKSSGKALPDDPVVSSDELDLLTHELGHALGLGHRETGCTVMNHYVNVGLRNCKRFDPVHGVIACGPSPTDARTLARLYRVSTRKRAGRCVEPKLSVAVVSPTAVVTVGEASLLTSNTVPVVVRNTGRESWNRNSLGVSFVSVNASGKVSRPCGSSSSLELTPDSVDPGEQSQVQLPVCIPQGSTGLAAAPTTSWLRYERQGVGLRYGPPLPVQVRFDLIPVLADVTATLPAPVAGGTQVDFSAAVSSDDAVAYAWDFGDAGSPTNTSTSPTPAHVYAAPGWYEVGLTVSDGAGQSVSGATSVLVE